MSLIGGWVIAGHVVCSQCSANKAPLRYKQWEAVRVCDSCYLVLEKGQLKGTVA